MDFMEQAISWLQTLPPVGVLAVMFLIAYIENIFPPSPSDAALVFAGTLIGIGVIGFAPALIVATLGSVLGFMTAYVLGRYFEQHFVSGRYHRFLPVNAIHQVERLFNRFGYGMVFANNWRVGAQYLALYSKVATVVFGAAVIVFLWRFFRKRRKAADSGLRIADSQSSDDDIKTMAPIESENRDKTASGQNQSATRNPQSAIE